MIGAKGYRVDWKCSRVRHTQGAIKTDELAGGGKKYEVLPHIVDHDLRLGIALLEAIAECMDSSW